MRARPVPLPLSALLLALLVPVAHAAGDDEAGAGSTGTRWHAEVKRQATDRGTESESTKTTLRLEAFPAGPVSQLRLEVPLPDEKQSFAGDPFNPRLGDIKLKLGLHAGVLGGLPLGSYLEVSLPTASPASLGSGKVQVTAGVRSSTPWTAGAAAAALPGHRWTFAWLVEQVVSVAGDAERADINYTKAELALVDTFADGTSLKLTLKPAIDWQKDGKSGAVLELEGGLPVGQRWRALLMLGGRLWGEGVKSTYGRRIELTARYRF